MNILLIALLTSTLSFADDDQKDRKIIYKEKTEIDFEGIEIAGALIKPQGTLILTRHSAHFNPLIKLRADFDKEMNDSVNEIK
jgi:hypothetical protein